MAEAPRCVHQSDVQRLSTVGAHLIQCFVERLHKFGVFASLCGVSWSTRSLRDRLGCIPANACKPAAFDSESGPQRVHSILRFSRSWQLQAEDMQVLHARPSRALDTARTSAFLADEAAWSPVTNEHRMRLSVMLPLCNASEAIHSTGAHLCCTASQQALRSSCFLFSRG